VGNIRLSAHKSWVSQLTSTPVTLTPLVICHEILMTNRSGTFPLPGTISVIAYTRVGTDPCSGNDQQFFSFMDKISKGSQFRIKGYLLSHSFLPCSEPSRSTIE